MPTEVTDADRELAGRCVDFLRCDLEDCAARIAEHREAREKELREWINKAASAITVIGFGDAPLTDEMRSILRRLSSSAERL